MGLSASQARLLSLTARQSNLEYEGQQINQQRTTLSNESSNYYNSLLEMSVPVPPSTNDYTKVVYTFTIGGNEATVKEALPIDDKEKGRIYTISYTTKLSVIGIQENEAYKTSASAKANYGKFVSQDVAGDNPSSKWNQADVENGQLYYLATMNRIGDIEEARQFKRTFGLTDTQIYVKSDDVTSDCRIMGPDGYEMTKATYDAKMSSFTDEAERIKYKKQCSFYISEDSPGVDATATRYALSYAQIPNETTFDAHKEANDRIYKIQDTDKNDPDAKKGIFTYKASNGNSFTVVEPEYAEAFTSADLDVNDYYQYESTSGIRFVKRNDVEGNLNTESITIGTSAVSTITKVKENVMTNTQIQFDKQGRISTVTDEEGITYTMTATTETDNAAYDDAYNQYEYNQYVYDQRQNEINANIEILQAQDKSLELRLSSLDTQHSAIQTELEAVKKVMSKNIDNSFKTFSA